MLTTEEEIMTQEAPDVEELDKVMGEPSPEVLFPPPKKMHLPPFKQLPYPLDLMSLEDLWRAPVPDWKDFVDGYADRYAMFYPELKPGMADSLEPITYWAVGDDLEDSEYKINKEFKEPDEIIKYCRVKGPRGYLEIDINDNAPFPKITMVIIFNAKKLAPHEALIFASQQYDDVAMGKDEWPYAMSQETLQCVLFADSTCFPEWKLYRSEVKFNSPELEERLCDHHAMWCNHIKNTLWEFVFIHIWSFFFINVGQPNKVADIYYNDLMAMKLLFLDKMQRVIFNSGTKMEIPHLEPFEYWFAQNGMIRLSYLGKMGLTWPGAYEYLNTNIGDRAALEAAGVKGTVKWKLVGDRGWVKETRRYINETCGEPQTKKTRKDKEEEEEEKLPKPSEPICAYEKVNGKWKKFTV